MLQYYTSLAARVYSAGRNKCWAVHMDQLRMGNNV